MLNHDPTATCDLKVWELIYDTVLKMIDLQTATRESTFGIS
jgi:hypothetical protein